MSAARGRVLKVHSPFVRMCHRAEDRDAPIATPDLSAARRSRPRRKWRWVSWPEMGDGRAPCRRHAASIHIRYMKKADTRDPPAPSRQRGDMRSIRARPGPGWPRLEQCCARFPVTMLIILPDTENEGVCLGIRILVFF